MSGTVLHLTFLVLYSSAAFAFPPIQIPRMDPGDQYDPNSIGAQVKVEVFLDEHCPDSLTAWTELKKVAAHYGNVRLDVVINQYPLPFHQYAQLASQGYYLVRDFVGLTQAFDYMEAMLQKWYLFSDRGTHGLTKDNVKGMMANMAVKVGNGLTREQFLGYIDFYGPVTTQAWKYGARRGVAGTPWYFINGVDLGISNPLSYQEFREILDPFYQSTHSDPQ